MKKQYCTDTNEWGFDSVGERVIGTTLVYLVAIPYAIWINIEKWLSDRHSQ